MNRGDERVPIGRRSTIDHVEAGDDLEVGNDQMRVTHPRASMTCAKCLNMSERAMIYCGPNQRISTGIDPWGAVLSDAKIDKLDPEAQENFCAGIPDEHFHLACPVCHYLWIEDLEDAHLTN